MSKRPYPSHKPRFSRNSSRRIDPSRYVRAADTAESKPGEAVVHAFSDFAVVDGLKANIATKGFSSPTPIQDKVIPLILSGRDVVGIAHTGTGKTAAFLIPLIDRTVKNPRSKVLVIAPTRELAMQIDDEFRIFSKGLHVRSALLIGGASMHNQIWKLKQHPQFVICTPGRLRDFIARGGVKMDMFDAVVLDEVDRMVDIGFIADIRRFMSLLPRERQTMVFSATVSGEVGSVIKSFSREPVTVSVAVGVAARRINQSVLHVKTQGEKLGVLRDLLDNPEFSKVLVFGSTRLSVERIAQSLDKRGYEVGSIHGNKQQWQRSRILEEFREGKLRILVATDVAARGLDIEGVTHVINFDEPQTVDDYTHRIGRTGRADKAGTAITFVVGY